MTDDTRHTRLEPARLRANRRYRASGRQIAVVLRDPDALAALDAGIRLHGGVTAAITHALRIAFSAARQ